MEYIVVQAGGKGTRLEHLTRNKPKALVTVENRPMLFHLFGKYPDKRYIIIGDYKEDVLRRYLECFAEVKYKLVKAEGSGTLGGLKQALEHVPPGETFMLIWSDLILPDDYEEPKERGNYVGISETFSCRWSYRSDKFVEEQSTSDGVAGLFIFEEKGVIEGHPDSGELVRYLSDSGIKFKRQGLAGTREFGTIEEYKKLAVERNRPFNKMQVKGDRVTKEPLNDQGRELANREVNWYRAANRIGIKGIPKIFGEDPLTMERIAGKNLYELEPDESVLRKVIKVLKEIHKTETIPADIYSIREAYYLKTMKRLDKVRELIPHTQSREIIVNGKPCRNVYYYRRDLENLLEGIKCERFSLIHGDCTFSNIMIRETGEPVLIDPRGYFGYTELYGDPNYDWAKLYYSIVGNYDRFNLKDFRLRISTEDSTAEIKIESNGWERLREDYLRETGADPETIKILHAVIWLSLTTYTWQDYDSICGAFYNGIRYLEECW